MSAIPQNLNWVEKRAACTVEQVFCELLAGVESDVAAANKGFSVRPGQEIFNVFKGILDTEFLVKRRGRIKHVAFARTETEIVIASDITNERWEFTLGLNDEGRCQLRRDGQEFEQWQVRKMALESMFFGS